MDNDYFAMHVATEEGAHFFKTIEEMLKIESDDHLEYVDILECFSSEQHAEW